MTVLCQQITAHFTEKAYEQQNHSILVVPTTLQDTQSNLTESNGSGERCTFTELLIENRVGDTNLTIVFLPGTHVADERGQFRISNAVNITMSAADLKVGATIDCNHYTGFAFVSVTNLKIVGLTFENCHYPFLSGKGQFGVASLCIMDSRDVSISNVSIRNGTGIGLYMESVYGAITVSHTKILWNSQNFYFLLEDRRNASHQSTNVSIADSEISHGMETFDIVPDFTVNSGLTLRLLQTSFAALVRLKNVTVTNNYFSNLMIETALCRTKIDIENLLCSNSENGLSIFLSDTLSCDSPFWLRTVNVKNASFLNSRLYAVNGDPAYGYSNPSSSSRAQYRRTRVVFKNITVLGSHPREDNFFTSNPTEFHNVQIELDNSLFKETEGIYMQNVGLTIRHQFLYERNTKGIVIFTSACQNRKTQVKLRRGSKTIFKDNNVTSDHLYGATFFARKVDIGTSGSMQLIFQNNSGRICGGMLLVKSKFTFIGLGEKIVRFSHNEGETGGALALFDGSTIDFDCGFTKLWFTGNKAGAKGGGIYVEDRGYVGSRGLSLNPFYVTPQFCRRIPVFYGYFDNNTAEDAGDMLYGGWLDSYEPPDPFSELQNDDESPSLVSSDPVRVCICEESYPNCNITELEVKLFPGQTLTLSAVAVGQRSGIVPSIVQAFFENNTLTGELESVHEDQSVDIECTALKFTVRSARRREDILLLNSATERQVNTINGPVLWDPSSRSKQLKITFLFQECPLGFYFDTTTKQCSCQQALLNRGIQCALNTFKVLRPKQNWINATFAHTQDNFTPGVIVHNHCPFDYCTFTEGDFMSLDLDHPDDQCAFNRSGVLCGRCQTHLSHVLGTSRCKKCQRPWIALIIPLMALVGMALVVLLIVLNLTVSTGTISGLIFYANIVRANSSVFFPPGVRSSHLSLLSTVLGTFIAWLNLDLGVEACLYNGLTAYVKTWLQFLFPLYIWLLVTVIIVVSHYSSTASRLCGNSAVQVLATLFLLSYAKLLRLIITIFSSTELVYPDGYVRRVWLYDGNVDYLRGKHIPLFVAGLVLLLFVSIPYSTVLLFIQCLQKQSFFKPLFWVRKLHPLFDAYTGPYKLKHRYWTGLLLLVRVSLFLVFSLNSLGDPSINLLSIVVVTFSLLAYTSLVGGIYKLWPLNVLENVFFLNLGVLSSAVGFYLESTDTVVPAIACTSVGITFLLFLSIVFYHLALKLSSSQTYRVLKERVMKRKQLDGKIEDCSTDSALDLPHGVYVGAVTQSVVELDDLTAFRA